MSQAWIHIPRVAAPGHPWGSETMHRAAWANLPVDGFGYCLGSDILGLPDDGIRNMVAYIERERYSGWRNSGNMWREHMGLDVAHGRVLDYGCGTGIEALQYARAGNAVSVADINAESVEVASRILELFGYPAPGRFLIHDDQTLRRMGRGTRRALRGEFDLVVMNGVLHHIEDPYPAVAEAHRVLRSGGELRVMVYTDRLWRLSTNTDPPEDVGKSPMRANFVRKGDPIGEWADWYDAARLESRFGRWFELREWHYVAPEHPEGPGLYGIGILTRKPGRARDRSGVDDPDPDAEQAR